MKDSYSDDDFKYIKTEPMVYVNAIHHFLMEKLHNFAGWLMHKTLPYVSMYEVVLEEFDDDDESV